nr:T7-like internal core protein [uncultured Mediterranean phage uvMED]
MEDNELDPLAVEQTEQLVNEFDNQQIQHEATAQAKTTEQAQETQALTEQADPRTAERWGLNAYAKEAQSILSGGLQDTASSLATFPERTVDAISGEMQRERKEKGYYEPEWQPFKSYEDPIVTKTWWGKLMRGTVHFGSMALGTVAAAKGLAVTGVPLLAGGASALLKAGSLTRAAGIGAASDLISKESDGHNALGALTKHYGWADTPLTTKDTDHPIMMKVKNIVEGMGIGLAFDGALYLVGKGGRKVQAQIAARNQNIEDQTIESGIAQIRKGEEEFRADKNSPIADRQQGAHVSEVDPQTAREQLGRTRNEWGSEDGSTGSVTRPLERERIANEGGTTDEIVETTLRGLMSSDKFARELELVKGNRKALVDTWRDAIEGHMRITQGRNALDMTPDEYLAELFATNDVVNGQEIWTSENVVVGDLVVGTLLKQLRDTGIAGREIMDLVSVDDIDGPAKQIIDTMLTALYETKKARFVKSDSFRQLKAGQKKAAIEQAIKQDVVDTKDSILSILKIAKDDPNDDLLNALFEAFSMMKNVNTLDDFDNWARTVLKGGKLDPTAPDRTGALIRSLQEMMSHSVLSGPKTPFRALLGTGTATFLRPLSTALGASMRYPFTGDAATIRASLASINALNESIPEAFELFFTKLNAYWKGDMSTIKTRYAEFTKGDENWEVIRRWAEDSGRATYGDRVTFAMTNMLRNLNNWNIFSYSTKLMAATDDTFRFMLGRAKMREKAMRRVLDLQGSGIELPEITPQLMKAYQDDFYGEIFDANGNIKDEATLFASKEVTLTQDLTGFAKGLNDVFSSTPLARPFFLFARTGVNGLALTGKHTPGFNFLVKEFNDIAFANPNNLDSVAKYGITNLTELQNAQALQTGRLGIGAAVTFLAAQAWMNGKLTGNGPADRQKRQGWIDAGYMPRTIELAGVRVGYDPIEPFNLIMSTIADVGDASELMGEEWTERELQKISLVVAQAISSKSYLAGIQSFVDLFAGRPGQGERILASLMNNQLPLAGLRNEMGKLFTPHMREIGSGIDQSIRNRNLLFEALPGEDLPIKYDMLNGSPIKPYDFMTRVFNSVSPISLNLTQSVGRQFLFESGYDLRLSTYYAPDSTNLTDQPAIRSQFQKAIGDQNLERQLDKLAVDPRAIASLEQMNKDIRDGKRAQYDARNYWHNGKIDQLFQQARKKAWASIMSRPDVQELMKEQKEAKRAKVIKMRDTTTILNMYK